MSSLPWCATSSPASSPASPAERDGDDLARGCDRHRLPVAVGVLLRQRDGADRDLARQHDAAGQAGQSWRRDRGRPDRDARAHHRRAADRQQHRQYRRLGAGHRHFCRLARRGRRALCHHRHDRGGDHLLRGAAQDRRPRHAGSRRPVRRTADEDRGDDAGATSHAGRADRARLKPAVRAAHRRASAAVVADGAAARRRRSHSRRGRVRRPTR